MPQTVPYDAIKPAAACRYDLIALGEVMLRIDPRDVPTARMRDNIRVSQGGGETNVACGAAYTFGLRAAVLSALVDDPIGENIRNQLREAGVDVSNIRWWNTDSDGGAYSTDQKGTLHNGISFTTAGRGVLPSETVYYRANTPAARLKPGDFDCQRLFAAEGTRVFSTGGILTLIGGDTADLAVEAARAAQASGTFVAADLNYRAKVEPNKERARAINQRLAPYLSMLVGNDSDLYDAFGYDTAEPERDTFEDWLRVYQDTIVKVARDFPNLSLVGTQWRGAHDADQISCGGRCCTTAAPTPGMSLRCASTCTSPTAPAAATRLPAACWRRCSRGTPSTPRSTGAPRTASWCRRPPATSPWSTSARWWPR